MGRALIASDIPGCREAVDEGENGYLVNAKEAESLYKALKAFLDLKPSLREQMGQKGHQKMAMEFRKEIVVQDTLKALGIKEEPRQQS